MNNQRTNKSFVPKAIRDYMAELGRKGGKISRRKLTPKQVAELTKSRRKYHLAIWNYMKLYKMSRDEAKAHYREKKKERQ